jgi:myosin heavy subunit
VLYGYAKTWAKVPWIAYEQEIDKEEAERLFGEETAGKLTYTDADAKSDEGKATEKQDQPTGGRATCRIYQIWDREGGKTVKYVCEQYQLGVLKEESDPLGLTGFFPCPKPLTFLHKSYGLTPTALYTLYEEQARELNEITRRIRNVTKAIKAKGVYDGSLGDDIKKLLEADDNEFVPADSAATMAEKGFDQAIWFMPVDKLIIVLRELYTAREQCKQVIYEITGISDILRGSSKASETLGAQEIKTQWGTLRLKNKQAEVQRYAKDLLRIMLELAASKLSEETWAKMTGLPFLLSAQYSELTAVAQALHMEVQRIQATQPPPQPGAPPPPPPPQVQQLQQLQQQLQTPQWAQVLELLRNDLSRAYRIDIETNSTVEADATDDKQQIQEVMGAISQLLNGLTPLVTSGALPFQAAQGLLLAVVRRYRFGAEIEDYIKAMQPPKPPDEGKGEAAKQQMAVAQKQVQMQQKEAEGAIRLKQMEAEQQAKQREMDLALREQQLRSDEAIFKMQQSLAESKLALRDQAHQVKVGAEEQVKKVKEQSTVREQQVAKQAQGGVTQSLTAVQRATQQVQQLAEAVTAMQAQAQATQQLLADLLTTAKAKRVKRAIRGTDNRIERVEEEILT